MPASLLKHYLDSEINEKSSSTIAHLAALDHLLQTHPHVAAQIINELKKQRRDLKLIASENYCSSAVQLAMGNWLTDKYAEGYPHHRFYAGCEQIDLIEQGAIDALKKLFGCYHAYVQPHSGCDANLVAFLAILFARVQDKELEKLKTKLDLLSPNEHEVLRKQMVGQKMMGMGLGSGGHLTHGYRHNISSKLFESVSYEVDFTTGLMDYKALEEQVKREKPLILIAGYSAYPRLINFAKMKEIADTVGAVFMVDMAHFAGLVAGKVMQGEYNPIPFADIVTSTTHKTLRGPRGGIVLCTEEFKPYVDRGCPMVLGGPLPHVMAAKLVAFEEALQPEFETYAHQIVKNAKILAETCRELGMHVLTDGTDNHLLVIDCIRSFGLTGRQTELALLDAHITVNRNVIPLDPNGAWYTSGIRIGTPALTTLGMKEIEMAHIARLMYEVLKNTKPVEKSKAKFETDARIKEKVHAEIKELLTKHPLYPEIILDF
ncbi:MAG: Serine hydroxymethyltransferase [Chlamydiae bacterium]|nr:Serine hydroxymethyltransferase [Chlamydiota bacterium]